MDKVTGLQLTSALLMAYEYGGYVTYGNGGVASTRNVHLFYRGDVIYHCAGGEDLGVAPMRMLDSARRQKGTWCWKDRLSG